MVASTYQNCLYTEFAMATCPLGNSSLSPYWDVLVQEENIKLIHY
ncbi:hypothetical protein FDUTEX481_05826 [Tolypothrix sp. PCC 7601]|nr:hypothetical protein FDUTEX481_05826 [Tolypothrix sp. PCC 7601]